MVVHGNKLPVLMGLFFDAVYTFREIFLGVIDRHNDGDERLFGHIFFNLKTQVIECLEKDRCVLMDYSKVEYASVGVTVG